MKEGRAEGGPSPQTELVCSLNLRRGGPVVEYLGIDWSYRRAAWCSLSDAGVIVGEGAVPADAGGLARLVIERGTDVHAVVEMMSGAIWVRDELAAAGWRVQIAHARKVRDASVAEPGRVRLVGRQRRVPYLPELRARRGLADRVAAPS
jgi:hypothetical protein